MVSLRDENSRMPFTNSFGGTDNNDPGSHKTSSRGHGRDSTVGDVGAGFRDTSVGNIGMRGRRESDTARLLASFDRSRDDIGTRSLPSTEFRFKRVETIGASLLLLICVIALLAVSVVMPLECEIGKNCYVNTFSLVLYLHCFFWGISLICDQGIQYEHIMFKRRGYLEFYCNMRTISQLPFWVVSAWNALLLSASTVLNDYCKTNDICTSIIPLKKSEYLIIFVGLECIVLIPIVLTYSYKVWNFNAAKSVPDVLRTDDMETSPEYGLNSVGQVDEEIYRRQADLIQHYREQNGMLRRTVMELNTKLCNRSTSTT